MTHHTVEYVDSDGHRCKLKCSICPYILSDCCKSWKHLAWKLQLKSKFCKFKAQNIPRMTAKIDDKRPNVNANGAETIIAWVFMSRICRVLIHMISISALKDKLQKVLVMRLLNIFHTISLLCSPILLLSLGKLSSDHDWRDLVNSLICFDQHSITT